MPAYSHVDSWPVMLDTPMSMSAPPPQGGVVALLKTADTIILHNMYLQHTAHHPYSLTAKADQHLHGSLEDYNCLHLSKC